ncbi:hypothetical protein LshimejAT787_0502810 [Lyophyllum shimeji]|uniref:Uncharacterized protein n=1 Tax=Lyophyllum shimeji TaxID=47721 RepID=A0A9P3PN95_LYOSH|nr:hypothetical protein LshimejAT787_0502810 [Lyophyllum shimeji]
MVSLWIPQSVLRSREVSPSRPPSNPVDLRVPRPGFCFPGPSNPEVHSSALLDDDDTVAAIVRARRLSDFFPVYA